MAARPIAEHGRIRELSDTEAAYIAGMIDADGTVTCSNRCRRDAMKGKGPALPQPMVLVVNSNLDLIRWLLETIGAGCAYEVKTRPTRPDQVEAHWNKVHRYQLTGWKAISLVERVRPFMRVKLRQANLLTMLSVRGRDFGQTAREDQRERAIWAGGRLRVANRRGKKE
jgi:hypothetical protein